MIASAPVRSRARRRGPETETGLSVLDTGQDDHYQQLGCAQHTDTELLEQRRRLDANDHLDLLFQLLCF